MKLFQPPLFSRIHSLRVPLLHEPLHRIIALAAPDTNENSDVHKLPEDAPCTSKDANMVLVEARPHDAGVVANFVQSNRLKPASLRHVLSLALFKPRLYEELAHGVPLIAVLATQHVVLEKQERIPLVWWCRSPGTKKTPKGYPERIAGLFWVKYRYKDSDPWKIDDEWDYYYWRAYLA